MGNILKNKPWARESYTVSSKVFWGGGTPTQHGLSRKHIHDACNAALKRLQVDYLDLFFCHRPDYDTPVEETVAAMTDLIRQGKILYWGTSEWHAREIEAAHWAAERYGLYGPTMEQPQYNLFERRKVEVDYLPVYERHGLGTTIWSPLSGGLLTGKYNDGVPGDTRLDVPGMEWLRDIVKGPGFEEKVAIARKLTKYADELGIPLARLALGWCLSNLNVSTVILGASKVSQLEENLKAIHEYKKLTPEILEKIETIAGTKPRLDDRF